MDKQTLIEGLNHDLAGEYQAIVQVLQHAYRMTGPERVRMAEYLKKLAMCKMEHAGFLAEKLLALGAMPAVAPTSISHPKDLRAMLEADLTAEKRAIQDHIERAQQAEAYGDIALKAELEELVADETEHAWTLGLLLNGGI